MSISFPDIPKCKQFDGQMTPEQRAFDKLVKKEDLTEEEKKTLEEAISFYEACFSFLKSINLSSVTDDDEKQITDFLQKVFNIELLVKTTFHSITCFA